MEVQSQLHLSQVAGWMYVMAWGLAPYPQFINNWRRRSVVGLSLDLAVLNPAGSLCLLAYYGSFAFSPSVRKAYRRAPPLLPPPAPGRCWARLRSGAPAGRRVCPDVNVVRRQLPSCMTSLKLC